MQVLNLRLTRDTLSRPWGFRLQGGFDSGSPLSVQRVFSGSPAEGILQRGDIVKHIENTDVENVTNKEVQDIIRASGRQLNFIVERDPNREDSKTRDSTNFNVNSGGGDDSFEGTKHIDVQAARRKFVSTENRAPPPFGNFGTQYEKKNDSVPTGVRLEMEHSFYNEEPDSLTPKNLMGNHKTVTNNAPIAMSSSSVLYDDQEERVDYSFMTLPVSERKKLFGNSSTMPGGSHVSRTVPRQRAYSYRPNTAIKQQPDYNSKTPQYGWGPNKPQTFSRQTLPKTQASIRLQREPPNFNQIQRSHASPVVQSSRHFFPSDRGEVSRQFSSSATIPRAAGRSWPNEYGTGHNTLTNTRHVFRGGLASTSTAPYQDIRRSVEPATLVLSSNSTADPYRRANPQTGTLYVKTYSDYNQSTAPLSPRSFKPAYPAYDKDYHRPIDNYSTISIRSEPYSRFEDRNMSFENAGVYRINRDVTPIPASRTTVNHMTQGMDSLHMGPPRTRVVASPASPSYHLNQPSNQGGFWSRPQAGPVRRMVVNVPKSQSQVTINQNRPAVQPDTHNDSHQFDNDNIYDQVTWLKQHRDSLAGASDF